MPGRMAEYRLALEGEWVRVRGLACRLSWAATGTCPRKVVRIRATTHRVGRRLTAVRARGRVIL